MSAMKKAKPVKRKSAIKRKSDPKSGDEYLADVPETARHNFNAIGAAIRCAVPAEATEVISYGIPAIKHNGVLL